MKGNKNSPLPPDPSIVPSLPVQKAFLAFFPPPKTKMKTAIRVLADWNKSLSPKSGTSLVFISQDQILDPSTFVLPFLVASAGIRAPVFFLPRLHYWNRLSLSTGMSLDLSPREFSRFLDRSLAAIGFPPMEIKILMEKDRRTSTASRLSFLQDVFFVLCLSSPQIVVFDIKIGRQENSMSAEQGFELARKLHRMCGILGIQSTSILSDFHQPLGQSFGKIHSFREGMNLLNGSGPADLIKLILELGTAGIKMATPRAHQTEIKSSLKNLLISGKVKEKARETIVGQGGSEISFDALFSEHGNQARIAVRSSRSGFIHEVSWARTLSLQRRLETIHPDGGLFFLKKAGDWVSNGESLGEIDLPGFKKKDDLERFFRNIFSISEEPAAYTPLILGRL